MAKDFTYDITIKTADGKIEKKNETNTFKGYRKAWYTTEDKARKSLNGDIDWAEHCGNEVISWKLYSRTGTIETSK